MENQTTMNPALVRSGTWGELWIDGEKVAECYGFTLKAKKEKEKVPLCRVMVTGHKVTSVSVTGGVKIYNATSRLIELEAEILSGKDHRHTIISNLADPDNPRNQRIVAKGVSFDDVTLADWEAAKLGTIDAPFTADSVEILDT